MALSLKQLGLDKPLRPVRVAGACEHAGKVALEFAIREREVQRRMRSKLRNVRYVG